MAEQSYSTVDVEAQAWCNIGVEFSFYNGPTLAAPDIKALKWKTSLEVGVQRFTSGQVKAYSRGNSSNEGSIELYAGGTIVLIQNCIAVAKTLGLKDDSGAYQYGRVMFDIPIRHRMFGETELRQVKLIGCRLKSDAFDGKEGSDVDTTELDLIVTRVERVIGGERAVLL